MSAFITVTINPSGRSILGAPEETLLQILRAQGIRIPSDCGGRSACGQCRVHIDRRYHSFLSPLSKTEQMLLSEEEYTQGVRLACQTRVFGDITIEIPDDGQEEKAQILTAHTSKTPTGRHAQPDKKSEYGAAFDIGTTTVAAYLYNLSTGKELASASDLNPQIPYGTDVISRIAYCKETSGGVKLLQSLILKQLNLLLHEMANQCKIAPNRITKVVLVGNTVMEHLLLGRSPECLGKYPFKPEVKDLLELTPWELPLLIHPKGRILIFPAADGFIGGDHISVLLSTNPKQYRKNTLVVDIGTNTEISLCSEGKLYSTSCATGPALEGGCIRFGMRAAKGAIDHVTIDPVTLKPALHVIGDCSPRGICGSGIIDAVAQMAEAGVLDPDGSISRRFASEQILKDRNGDLGYLLFDPGAGGERILITQEDIRAVQLAKAALYAGIQILLKHSGVSTIDRILLAGGFGCYLDKIQALKLGLFPDCDPDIILPVGNAAGAGAILALLNEDHLSDADHYCQQIHFTESASDPDFQKFYREAMFIPHKSAAFRLGKPLSAECPGLHKGMLPISVFAADLEDLEDGNKTLALVKAVSKAGNKTSYTLPLLQNLEACVYGAPMEKKKGYWAPGAYPFTKVEALEAFSFNLMGDARIQAVLDAIRSLRRENDPCIILEASTPFTILTALIDPRKIYAAMRKKPELIQTLLQRLADAEIEYLEQALSAGCTVISLADPLARVSLIGEKQYKEILAPSLLYLMKKMRRYTKKGLIHLCGKMATDLITCGYGVCYPLRTPEAGCYAEQLAFAAEDPKIRIIGPGCVHSTCRKAPIIQLFELNNGGK